MLKCVSDIAMNATTDPKPPPEVLRALSERLRTALALYESGIAMKRAQLRRQDGAASEEEIARRFTEWLHARPGAPFGDAQISALLDRASSEKDYVAHDFLEWFAREQLEEVSTMDTLLKMVQRTGEKGLIVADRFEAAILREAPVAAIAPARRRALLLKLARLGAFRLHGLQDPQA
jgi:hypothetical protein